MNNIISLYIFKILINVASHSYIHQSRYKTATVDIQRGLPEIGLPRSSKDHFKGVYIGTHNDCVFPLSPNYLSDTYSANKC